LSALKVYLAVEPCDRAERDKGFNELTGAAFEYLAQPLTLGWLAVNNGDTMPQSHRSIAKPIPPFSLRPRPLLRTACLPP